MLSSNLLPSNDGIAADHLHKHVSVRLEDIPLNVRVDDVDVLREPSPDDGIDEQFSECPE